MLTGWFGSKKDQSPDQNSNKATLQPLEQQSTKQNMGDNNDNGAPAEINLVPAWMLAPYEEKEVRARCQENANKQCARQFFEFGQCSKQHQLLFSWKCAEQKDAMIQCVAKWGSDKVFAEEREKYVKEKEAKIQAEREQIIKEIEAEELALKKANRSKWSW